VYQLSSKAFCIILMNWLLLAGNYSNAWAQKVMQGNISGKVTDIETKKPIAEADVVIDNTPWTTQTNLQGEYVFKDIPKGSYKITFFKSGWYAYTTVVIVREGNNELNIDLKLFANQLDEIQIIQNDDGLLATRHLNSVENMAIYEGKKTELIEMKEVTANLSTNNARQIFGKIPGLNIWESDGGGLQMGIGSRGLSPNRMGNFNVRQNGYDIAADAIGYPESYYTPPMEAVERIEVVRGAGALQYGSQFGGMLNFVMKKGDRDAPIKVTSRQTLGSYGLFNSFNSVGGTIKDVNYYSFVQHKRGDGWRANSRFETWAYYGRVGWQLNSQLQLYAEYTHNSYKAQQPGGLTYRQFVENPRQSYRNRNWFSINWNLFSAGADYKINSQTAINTRFFGLLASRQSLGNLSKITEADFAPRTLIIGNYQNIGNETRFIHTYYITKYPSVFLAGFRAYQGNTYEKHGEAQTNTSESSFRFKAQTPLYSDYRYPGENYAFFVENLFHLSPKFTLTPGIRWEAIRTQTQGNYFQTIRDGAGNPYISVTDSFAYSYPRRFFLLGIGVSYKPIEDWDLYANITQNYRPITFSGIAIRNLNRIIDPTLKDERGYNADLGFRGRWKNAIQWDLSIFALTYQNRIGFVEVQENFISKRKTTNVANSLTYGFEGFAECNVSDLLRSEPHQTDVLFFGNIALINARYTQSENPALRNRYVEFVPPYNMRYGLTAKRKKWRTTLQYAITAQHYTDATNAIETPDAVNGIIPQYQVWDFSAQYELKKWLQVETSVNNLLNAHYFTRRADGYPGPGIIPSDGRTFYLTLQGKF